MHPASLMDVMFKFFICLLCSTLRFDMRKLQEKNILYHPDSKVSPHKIFFVAILYFVQMSTHSGICS